MDPRNASNNNSTTSIINTGNEKFDGLMNNKSKFETQLNTIVGQSSIYLESLNDNDQMSVDFIKEDFCLI